MFSKKTFVDGQTVIDAAFLNSLQEALADLLSARVKSVNGVPPDEATGDVTLTPKDLRVQIPGTGFQDTLQILLETLWAGSEHDVTEAYDRWSASESGTVTDFFLSDAIADPGAYTVRRSGDTHRMRYLIAGSPDEYREWRWIIRYTEDGFFAAELYCNKELVISFDPDGGVYKVYDDALALKSDLAAAGGAAAFTEIEKLRPNRKSELRSIRVSLNGLTPLDDGHLRLALWRCDRKYARHRWVPARKISDKEDHSVGYSRLDGHYASDVSGPDYPPTPAWMPNEGLAESFYSVYAEDGSLLPYVEIPLDSFVLPLVKPVGVLPDKSGWSGDPWDTCGVVGTDNAGGFLRFRFDVEKEDGTVLARCQNTLKVGAKNLVPQTPSVGLLKAAEPGSPNRQADLKNWYIRVE